MYKNNFLANSVRFALVSGAMTAAFTAPAALAAEEDTVERIEVTGSRIKRTDMESASPVSVIDAGQIAAMGITRLDDVLRQMTAASGAALGTNVNNGSGGKATVNIRGLGAARTLVLVNGRRMVNSGIGANSSVDLNNIPLGFIKRIEVLKDGASAVYGSDAIAGVVNVILKDDYEGLEFNAQTGQTFESDGKETTLSLTMGTNFDKGNITAYMGYTDKEEVRQADRDFSSCPIFEFLDLDGDGKLDKFCGGSSGTVGGRGNLGQFLPGGQTLGPVQPGQATYKPYSFFEDSYNYSELSYLETPRKQFQINVNGTYELSDNVGTFIEAMYTKRTSNQQMAPTRPNSLGTAAADYYYNPTNPDGWFNEQGYFNDVNGDGVWDENDAQEVTIATRRMTDIGPRIFSQNTDTYRAVFGFNGDFEVGDRAFDWEVFYQYGRNDGRSYTENQVNRERFAETIDKDTCVMGGNGVDQVPCANWFGTGWMSEEQLAAASNYVTYTEVDTGFNTQEIYGANIAGELFDMPAGGFGIAAGVEHRAEEGFYNPDVLSQYGIGGGNATLPTAGEFSVDEAYVELAIPLLEGLPGVERLDMSAAIRYFDYSTFGDDYTWNVGATWSIFDGLMVRSKYTNQAFRAPSINDLNQGASDSYDGFTDVCNDYQNNSNATIKANCAADLAGTGFTEQDDGQVRAVVGGNSDLQPEKADIFTVGFVYDASALIDGLSLTVDYYDIEITDAIGTIGATYKLEQCYSATDGGVGSDQPFCKDFIRDADGQVDGILRLKENANVEKTTGIDTNIAYAFEAASLDWRIDWETTWVDENSTTDSAGNYTDYVGFATSNAGSVPEWKSNLGFNVSGDDWAANYQVRYIHSLEDESLNDLTPEERAETIDAYANPDNLFLDAVWYHDASVSYNVMDNLKLQLGVNNIFDTEPEYYVSYNDSNTDIYTYDLAGRRWYLQANLKF